MVKHTSQLELNCTGMYFYYVHTGKLQSYNVLWLAHIENVSGLGDRLALLCPLIKNDEK